MKIYIATPVVGSPNQRIYADKASANLRERGFDTYAPWEMIIPHAWDYPNNEWAQMVFARDIAELEACDWLVLLSYGRESTAGANWEAGYAYGRGKQILVVEMTDTPMSLMVSNGSWARVRGLDGLSKYDFDAAPFARTDTEQK